jgi:hypothetical protein
VDKVVAAVVVYDQGIEAVRTGQITSDEYFT